MNATGNNPSGTMAAAPVDGSGNQGEGPEALPPDTPVLIPTGGESDTSNANAQLTGDGSGDVTQQVAGSTNSGATQVPLADIANEFSNRATDALGGTNIAPSEADTVARYFDAVNKDQ